MESFQFPVNQFVRFLIRCHEIRSAVSWRSGTLCALLLRVQLKVFLHQKTQLLGKQCNTVITAGVVKNSLLEWRGYPAAAAIKP